MQFQVTVKAGDRVVSSATVAELDPATDVAQMVRSALQLTRDRTTGLLVNPPELTVTVSPITE